MLTLSKNVGKFRKFLEFSPYYARYFSLQDLRMIALLTRFKKQTSRN